MLVVSETLPLVWPPGQAGMSALNEFILTKRPYLRTVTSVLPKWLLQLAPKYFELKYFPDGLMKRVLFRAQQKMLGNAQKGEVEEAK